MLRILLVAAALAVTACSPGETPKSFRNTDITGADYAQGFALTDHTGQARTLADFKGKAVSLFFGFTQCPDVCPTNLLTMTEVMRLLGPDADRLQVLFMTVDPERDTQALLAEYMPAFDARFLGLYGDLAQTEQIAKNFKVFYRKAGDTSGPNYTIDHSAGTYLFDSKGRIRLYVKHGASAEDIAADVKALLAE